MVITGRNISFLSYDVVVLGTGFAGLKAAYSALTQDNSLKIAIISLDMGLTGSSFKNINKRVGIQVLKNDCEREEFVKRVLKIASPGRIRQDLVEILAQESEQRFSDLLKLNIKFLKDKHGKPLRVSGCFFPEHNSAFIIEDLKHAFLKFYLSIKDKIDFLTPLVVLKLVLNEDRKEIVGILGYNFKAKEFLAIKCKSVVVSLGGCAPLFCFHNAWESPFSGYSYALLKNAGVKLINQGFVQMQWARRDNLKFFSFGKFKQGIKIIKNGQVIEIPDKLMSLIDLRNSHCPIAYSFKDFDLDCFLLDCSERKGVRIKNGDMSYYIVPVTQAQNGGAAIDHMAMTNISGIFACGECASGMHGANRIGGAMILSSQVFGYRAGKFAAIYAKEKKEVSDLIFTNLINDNTMLNRIGELVPSNNLLSQSQLNGLSLVKALLIGHKAKLESIYNKMSCLKMQCSSYLDYCKISSLMMVVKGRIDNIKG